MTEKETEYWYKLYNLANLPIVAGNPKIKKVDKGFPSEIYSLGSGKQTGEQTSLSFSMALTYAGEMIIDERIYDLFLFPEKGIEGKDLFCLDIRFYLMLEVIDDIDNTKWFLYRPKDNKIHTVKKIFNKYIPKEETK